MADILAKHYTGKYQRKQKILADFSGGVISIFTFSSQRRQLDSNSLAHQLEGQSTLSHRTRANMRSTHLLTPIFDIHTCVCGSVYAFVKVNICVDATPRARLSSELSRVNVINITYDLLTYVDYLIVYVHVSAHTNINVICMCVSKLSCI